MYVANVDCGPTSSCSEISKLGRFLRVFVESAWCFAVFRHFQPEMSFFGSKVTSNAKPSPADTDISPCSIIVACSCHRQSTGRYYVHEHGIDLSFNSIYLKAYLTQHSSMSSSTAAAATAAENDDDVKVVLEQTLLTCPEVFVYKVPPMMTSGGHRAEDWNLATPLATCSLVVMRRDGACLLRLMTERPKTNGPPGATEPHLFAKCCIELDFADPTKKIEHWVEAVVDSSRYSVIRISDERTGREAHIGMGFRERTDAVNFKMSLQEYENALRRERKAEAMHDEYERSHPTDGGGGDGAASADGSSTPPGGDSLTPPSSAGVPAISKLTLKEGEKIHVKIKGVTDKDHGSGGGGLRKSTAVGLSGRTAPPAGALVGKGGLLLKKPPSDRHIAPAPAPAPASRDSKATTTTTAPSSAATSTTSGTSTPEESSNEPRPSAAAAAAAAAGHEGDSGADDADEDDEFGDFEEA